jgi:hypothetical protein
MRSLCELAGRPDQAAGFIAAGTPLPRAHQHLLEAAAEALPADWPVAAQALQARRDLIDAQDHEARATTPKPSPSLSSDADQAAALAYAAEVGMLCELAGQSERALQAIEQAPSLRVLRAELQAAQRARTAENHIDNLHTGLPSAPGPRGIDARAIYAARARAMGQTRPETRQ